MFKAMRCIVEGVVVCMIVQMFTAGVCHSSSEDGEKSGDVYAGGATSAVRLMVNDNHLSVFDAAFSEDGQYVIYSTDVDARLFEMNSKKEIRRFIHSGDHRIVVSLTLDGKTAVTGSVEGKLRIWDVDTGMEIREISVLNGGISKIAVSPNGKYVLTGNEDGTAILWDIHDGQEVRRFKVDSESVSAISFSSDGERLLTGGHDGIARLWMVSSGDMVMEFPPHSKRISDVQFSPSGRLGLTASNDGSCRVWDVSSGREVKGVSVAPAKVSKAAFLRDEKRLIIGFHETAPGDGQFVGTVVIWDMETEQEVSRVPPHAMWITALATSPDESYILTGGFEGTVRLWDVKADRSVYVFKGGTRPISDIAVSKSTASIFMAISGKVSQWDLKSGVERRQFIVPEGIPPCIAVSPNGSYLLTSETSAEARVWTARLWNVITGKVRRTFEGHKDRILAVAFASNGGNVVTASKDMLVRVWDMFSVDPVYTIAVPLEDGEELKHVAFSSHAEYALVMGDGGTVGVLENSPGGQFKKLEMFTDKVSLGVFSSDGKRLGVGDEKGNVYVVDRASGSTVRSFPSNPSITGFSSIVGISFSEDDDQLTISYLDGRIRQVDIQKETSANEFHVKGSIVLSHVSILGGAYIVSGGSDGMARLWDTRRKIELVQFGSFRDGSWAVVDRDGRFDASGGGEVSGLHWVVGKEPVLLAQLKERYFVPGLLSKYIGYESDLLPDVKSMHAAALYPKVDLKWGKVGEEGLRIKLVNQGGGLGKVTVWVNGKEIVEDARGAERFDGKAEAEILLRIENSLLIAPSVDNLIEVQAQNEEGYLSSPLAKLILKARASSTVAIPSLWAVIVGVSDYAGDQLDLKFAAEDAKAMATAILLGGEKWLGPTQVNVQLLTSPKIEGSELASKGNIVSALRAVSQAASPQDIVVVYFAGHGTSTGGVEGDYYFLTAEARSGELSDPAIRQARAISSRELAEVIRLIPTTREVLILDTCGAGGFIDRMASVRQVSPSQRRALDRLKDRTGMYILAGSAADAVSYEANQFRQGLLTYSLLLGMKGEALRGDEWVSVGPLFHYSVETVQLLASGLGGIQKPQFIIPRSSGSFDIGQLTSAERARIPLATPIPLFTQVSFQDADNILDRLELSSKINRILREISNSKLGSEFLFLDTFSAPSAYTIAGRYKVSGASVVVDYSMFHDGEKLEGWSKIGSLKDVDGIAEFLVGQVREYLKQVSRH